VESVESLRTCLGDAVHQNPAEGLLFSGGLDTSVLACLSPTIPALHVCLDEGGEDLPFAERVARKLSLDLKVRHVSQEEALDAVARVIRIRRSFDPALPNDLALYFAFDEARQLGWRSVMTGDGADELFAGYSFMFDRDLEEYLPWLVGRMRFSANEFGGWFAIRVAQPYLDRRVVDLALSIPAELKVRMENGQRCGKWILRKAFEKELADMCWQGKRPIETGSGFTRLRQAIADMVSASDWDAPVQFISPDHPYYYRVYRQVIGDVPPPGPGEVACPGCGAGLPPDSAHCRVCGWSK
jgi:asparagine synthase (glutamine-hydrolysing)